MNYLEIFQYIQSRIGDCKIPSAGRPRKESEEDVPLDVTPIECASFEQLCRLIFFQENDAPGTLKLEHTQAIEDTLATMSAVVVSTTYPGGQLALRVIGPPGSTKSTLAEIFSCCRNLVYARSKFTGIVSGWSSLKKSRMTANKIDQMCVLIKDADTMIQQKNYNEIESELRDALGDGVIRAEYRTGRDFEIRTLFTLILCGTLILKDMDNVILGARFLDIFIHDPKTDTKKIIRRSIESAFSTLCSSLSGERKKVTNNNISHHQNNGLTNKEDEGPKLKPIIGSIAPALVGFLLHQVERLKNGVEIIPPTEKQKTLIDAMAELVSHVRQRSFKNKNETSEIENEREIGTRLSEQLSRLLVFLGVILQSGNKVRLGKKEFRIARKVVLDTIAGRRLQILQAIREAPHGLSSIDIAAELDLGVSTIRGMIDELRTFKLIHLRPVSNPHGNRGRKTNVYVLSQEIRHLMDQVDEI